MKPLFSVIMPTRNRPGLFRAALQSVLDQTFTPFEVIVVDDGSSESHAGEYRALLAATPEFVRVLRLASADRGHGQSYALNVGASCADGEYLCFLDDDDQWTDPQHLRRIAGVIENSRGPSCIVLANQQAFRNGVAINQTTWIEDLEPRLGRQSNDAGAYEVTPAELLGCQAHCHLNTMTISTTLYASIGGMDEGIRYECDRDLYLRAIDAAERIMFLPNVVSRHNVPDPGAKSSMSTSESLLSKRLYQLRVFDKAALFSSRPEVRRYAMRQKGYVLKHIAKDSACRRQFDRAAYYARQGLVSNPSPRWFVATVLYQARHLLSRDQQRA